MNRLLLFILLATGFANAQIVNIPDANFKAKLIAQGIDSNADGNIQLSEAQFVSGLNVNNSYIADLTGVEAFVNLSQLYCNNNQLTSLPVQNLTHLNQLSCSNNQISSLNLSASGASLEFLDFSQNLLSSIDLSPLVNLKTLYCNDNLLTFLDLSALSDLENLSCFQNQLTSLNVETLTTLTKLNCDGNQLTALYVAPLTNLTELSFASNQISSIDLSMSTNLISLRTAENPLVSLDVMPLINLMELKCYSNGLTSLAVTPLTNLMVLQCGDNDFNSLDVTPLTHLWFLECNATPITSLDVHTLTNLKTLLVDYNHLTTLDVTQQGKLTSLNCMHNELTSLYIKNGINETLYLSGNPNLTYICADETQVAAIQAQVTANTLVSSYCSFVPGGNYNSVTGTGRFDQSNNGCDVADFLIPEGLRVNISNGTISSGTFTNATGVYTLYAATGNYNLSAQLENPAYFNVSPTGIAVNFPLQNSDVQTNNFCVTANGVHPDVEIILIPIGMARPGFDAKYQLTYKNIGNQVSSGTVNLGFNESVLDFVSASIPPDGQNASSLSWNYLGLQPFETRSINITLNVNSSTETPPVVINDTLDFAAHINPVSGDEFLLDNQFIFHQIVVGSFDPNNKICLEGNVQSPEKIGDYLHYVINFENTGTFPAENVVIKDMIDPNQFDISTLQVLGASHTSQTNITGNKAEFIFQDIDLAPNEYGYMAFKVKTKSTLQTGDSATNNANIYFDFNFPVETNMASTAFQSLGIHENALEHIRVYPNPTKHIVNIHANSAMKSIAVFDIQGRIVESHAASGSEVSLDVSRYAKGIYYLKIITDTRIHISKIIKE
jgi:Leucine-rich repeat (LRR) protein